MITTVTVDYDDNRAAASRLSMVAADQRRIAEEVRALAPDVAEACLLEAERLDRVAVALDAARVEADIMSRHGGHQVVEA